MLICGFGLRPRRVRVLGFEVLECLVELQRAFFGRDSSGVWSASELFLLDGSLSEGG